MVPLTGAEKLDPPLKSNLKEPGVGVSADPTGIAAVVAVVVAVVVAEVLARV